MSTPSRQPTHHGYAVNVKDHGRYDDYSPLSEHEAQSLYDMHAEDFWRAAEDVAREHGFRTVYSEGRMGGWAVPHPEPVTDDMWPHEVEAWEQEHFRPFEVDLLALLEDCRERYADALAEEIVKAKAEPAERAYWAARDVETTS